MFLQCTQRYLANNARKIAKNARYEISSDTPRKESCIGWKIIRDRAQYER